jgi:hypothetical protein
MDRIGKGVPYVIAGCMVLASLVLTSSMEKYAQPPSTKLKTRAAANSACGDVTGPRAVYSSSPLPAAAQRREASN